MAICIRCNRKIRSEDLCLHPMGSVCEDCYIDLLMPPMPKMIYENDPGRFMMRLKDSHIACPQRFH